MLQARHRFIKLGPLYLSGTWNSLAFRLGPEITILYYYVSVSRPGLRLTILYYPCI